MSPIRLGDAGWERSDAQQIVDRALQFEECADPTAEDRVWTRIESRRARGVRLVWSMFAAGAACAVVASILVLKFAHRESAVLPFIVAADGSQKTLKLGQPLPVAKDTTLVDLHGAGRMVAESESTMVFDEFNPRAVSLRVDSGSVLLHVAPRPADAPFMIRTPSFTAKVVGTVLHVAVRDGRSTIAVGHGRVEVEPVGSPPVIVASGQRWPADAREVPRPELFERLGANDLEGTAPAVFVPPAEPARETARSCDGAPDEAMRCYLDLAKTADPARAESALYEAGWIALRDLREPAHALRIWSDERRRFPAGLLADEAQTSTIDALVALNRTARARAEIDGYLRHHPQGLRAAEMHFVKGTLLVQADHNCRRAMSEFSLALRHPAPPWDAKARAALGRCQQAPAR